MLASSSRTRISSDSNDSFMHVKLAMGGHSIGVVGEVARSLEF